MRVALVAVVTQIASHTFPTVFFPIKSYRFQTCLCNEQGIMTCISGIIVKGCYLRLSKNQLDWFSAYKKVLKIEVALGKKCFRYATVERHPAPKRRLRWKWCVNKQMQKYLMTASLNNAIVEICRFFFLDNNSQERHNILVCFVQSPWSEHEETHNNGNMKGLTIPIIHFLIYLAQQVLLGRPLESVQPARHIQGKEKNSFLLFVSSVAPQTTLKVPTTPVLKAIF